MNDNDELEKVITIVLTALKKIREEEFDDRKCSAMAAAALEVQCKLADILATTEFEAKHAKNELEFVIGERAIEIRKTAEPLKASGKVTEGQIEAMVNKDPEIKEKKLELEKTERVFKKWYYLSSSMKEAHIFFRGLEKNKNSF